MFSQTVEYALRAMMFLAGLDGAPVSSDRIAASIKVPSGYLSKVMRDLVVGHLVASQRGPGGGFTLARTPRHITILDVVNAVDPIRRIHRCPLGNSSHEGLCKLHQRLDSALAGIERAFSQSTLADLLESGEESSRCSGTNKAPPRPRTDLDAWE